jgi:hypothetical protein
MGSPRGAAEVNGAVTRTSAAIMVTTKIEIIKNLFTLHILLYVVVWEWTPN